jgi:Na+/proline symporter
MSDDKSFGPELWGVIGAYLAVLGIIIAYVSYKDNKQASANTSSAAVGAVTERPKNAAGGNTHNANSTHSTQYFSRHFLASREMGPIVLGFSLCASMFSGYTCVGIPAESFRTGFGAWRWVGSCTFISLVYLSYAPRLNLLSKKFGYNSLLAFARDRYGFQFGDKGSSSAGIKQDRTFGDTAKCCLSQALYVVIVLVILVPCFIYLIAQFIALANTLNSLSDGVLSKPLIAIVFAILLFLCETMGGLRAVAATDVIQGSFLLACALLVFFFLEPLWGGVDGITEKLESGGFKKHVVGGLMDTGEKDYLRMNLGMNLGYFHSGNNHNGY